MRLDLLIVNNLPSLLKKSGFLKKIQENITLLPRSFWQKEINLGNIKYKNKTVKPSIKINVSEKLSINFDWINIKNNWLLFYKKALIPSRFKIDFLKINSDCLAINKPAGISVHPSFPLKRDLVRKPTLIEGVICKFPDVREAFEVGEEERPGIVHRLDKETSGAVLIARNIKTKLLLKNQFKNRQIKKTYFALVEGSFPYEKFKIFGLMGKRAANPMKMGMGDIRINDLPTQSKPVKIINPKESLTLGEKIADGTLGTIAETLKKTDSKKIFFQWKNLLILSRKTSQERIFSFLKLHPHTGRTHQIRLHLGVMGFPVVGDCLYGSKRRKGSWGFHCLHSYSIKWFDSENNGCFARSNKLILF